MNKLYWGDNLKLMQSLKSESIDLIYVDPPFYTNRVLKGKNNEYIDIWETFDIYIDWLNTRLKQMYRLLKPTGSLFVHLDYRAVHYIKMKLDTIFGNGVKEKGFKNLVNELIWCYTTQGIPKDRFSKKHDTILWYSKEYKKHIYNKQYEPYSEITLKRWSGKVRKVKGDKYTLNPLGMNMKDYWTDINTINNVKNKRNNLVYPTQKPVELLERIVKTASNEGDLVADFFSGSGTTLQAASNLNRNWIGCDENKQSIEVIQNRLKDINFDLLKVVY